MDISSAMGDGVFSFIRQISYFKYIAHFCRKMFKNKYSTSTHTFNLIKISDYQIWIHLALMSFWDKMGCSNTFMNIKTVQIIKPTTQS